MTLKIALGCIQPQQNQLLRPHSSFLEHTSVLVYISWKAHHNVAPCFQIECASHCEVQQRDHKTLYRVCMMSVFTLFTNPELCFRCEKRWNERSDFYSFFLKAKTKHSECFTQSTAYMVHLVSFALQATKAAFTAIVALASFPLTHPFGHKISVNGVSAPKLTSWNENSFHE